MGIVKMKQNIKKGSYPVRVCLIKPVVLAYGRSVLSHTAHWDSKQAQSFIHFLMLVCEYMQNSVFMSWQRCLKTFIFLVVTCSLYLYSQ